MWFTYSTNRTVSAVNDQRLFTRCFLQDTLQMSRPTKGPTGEVIAAHILGRDQQKTVWQKVSIREGVSQGGGRTGQGAHSDGSFYVKKCGRSGWTGSKMKADGRHSRHSLFKVLCDLDVEMLWHPSVCDGSQMDWSSLFITTLLPQCVLWYLKKKLLPLFKLQYSALFSYSWQNLLLCPIPAPPFAPIFTGWYLWCWNYLARTSYFFEANSLKSINRTHVSLKIPPNFLLIDVVLFVDLIYALFEKKWVCSIHSMYLCV